MSSLIRHWHFKCFTLLIHTLWIDVYVFESILAILMKIDQGFWMK